MCENKAFQGQLRTYSVLSTLFHTLPRVGEVVKRTRGSGEHTHRFQKIPLKQSGRFKAGADLWEKWINKMNTLLDNEVA